MSSSVMRVVLGLVLTVAPWFFHQKKILGNQPENYAQSESVMLFGQAISKASYMGILDVDCRHGGVPRGAGHSRHCQATIGLEESKLSLVHSR